MNLPLATGSPCSYRRLRGAPRALSIYRRLYGDARYGFLYESLEEHGTQGRFSFLGGRPRVIFRSRGDQIRVRTDGGEQSLTGDPLVVLRELVAAGEGALPVATFPGGAVGYLGYDLVRFFAPVPDRNPGDLALPDAYLVFPNEVLILDHLDEVVHVLLYGERAPSRRIREIEAVVEAVENDEPPPDNDLPHPEDGDVTLRSNMTESQFAAAVERVKEYIRAGEIFQAVLSQRFEFPLACPPLDLYAALRRTNPSPYMYYLNLDGLHVSGSSPEILVKLTGRRVVIRPLAGTRPRGATPETDEALARELLADEKERAEHLMLVDLARNDIGRDCRAGSVRVEEFNRIERYSKVMHLVSNVTGRLRDDRDAFDLLRSTFPAGTVSGAPKIRAMQIIDELEPVRRGLYAGAIGYFSYLGDMDLCIAIRTIVCRGERGYLQVGAGIVADSVPRLEYQETLNKARGLVQAIRLAAASRQAIKK